jgi:hypothetical protein
MSANNTGYAQGSRSSGMGAPVEFEGKGLENLKKDYQSYLDLKAEEIKEQQQARRYYHCSQWTAKQIKALNDRNQPVVTFNRIARKLNAIVGLNEKQRLDPRGYPRTPKHEAGAEIATASLRYVLDAGEWSAKSSEAGLTGAVDGLGGMELILEQGDKGDAELGFEVVEPASFFYDPRSLKPDFSDAKFQGVGKWADVDTVIEMFPKKEAEINASMEAGSELTSNPDSDVKWITGTGNNKKLRLIDHWYKKGGKWQYCVYTGATILAEGDSPYIDEKKKTFCKFIMYSAFVDQDGDRYGFVRNMKSSQDEINMRRSKGMHLLNSRRIIAEEGAFKDVEKARKEAARPDGIIITNPGMKAEFDDAARNAEMQGQVAFLEDAKNEIENYGFNPALMGQGVQDMSGRAIQLQQSAGIAELGPYLISLRGWKIRFYRAVWNAIQTHWTAERWIRVTDDNDLAQFFAVNQLTIDPQSGQPVIANALGSLDVDIIIDEGPDTINMQADAFDTLSLMASKGAQIPPQLLIEMSPLSSTAKKKYQQILQQAQQANAQNDPMKVKMAEVEANMKAKAAEMQADSQMKREQMQADIQLEREKQQASIQMQREKNAQDMQTEHDKHQMTMQFEAFKANGQNAANSEQAKVIDTLAAADLKRAQTEKTIVETQLLPEQMKQKRESVPA